MRAILAILGLAAVVLVIQMALGMVRIEQTSDAALPQLKFEGGKAPEFKADMGRVGMGSTNTSVEMPTIEMKNVTVELPTVEVEKASGNTQAPAAQ